MSIADLAKRYATGFMVVIAAAIMTAYLSSTSSSFALAQFMRWLAFSIFFPLTLYLAFAFSGDVLGMSSSTSRRAVGFLIKELAGPAVFAYLFLEGTLAIIPRTEALARISNLFSLIYIVILGALIRRVGNRLGDMVRSSIMSFGLSIIMLGFSGILSILYVPLGLLLLYPAVAILIKAALSLLGLRKSLRPVSMDAMRVSNALVAMFFVIGFVGFIGGIPQLAPYGDYVFVAQMVVLLLAITAVGYRLYTAYSRTLEGMAERIYEQHVRESPIATTSDDDELINAVRDFAMYGRNEELIAYASYFLARCDMEFKEVKKILQDLIDYKSPEMRGLWPWERTKAESRMNDDARIKARIIERIINSIYKCGSQPDEQQKEEPRSY